MRECISPVCLPDSKPKDFNLCWGAGWGEVKNMRRYPYLVQYHSTILPRDYCIDKSYYNQTDLSKNQFCSGNPTTNEQGFVSE